MKQGTSRCSFPKTFRLIKRMNRLVGQKLKTALQEAAKNSTVDPFRVLVTTILSQRTRDENTRKASDHLFSYYPDVRSLAGADIKHVEELIRPSGFYHVKARSIISASKVLIDNYNGKVPRSLDKLLELPSVGRKTANCVLAYGFQIPAIPVDTHVHRISNRLAIVKTRTPEQTEHILSAKVQRRYWLDLNEEFVRFGQRICKPVVPECPVCILKQCCCWYRRHLRERITQKARGKASRVKSHSKGSR